MKPLFSPEGERALNRFLLQYPDPLVLLDFDGTLAPIVRAADRARMSSAMRAELKRLSRHYRVGVLSGRSLQDLSPRLPAEIRLRIGNHGMEVRGLRGAGAWKKDAMRAKKLARAWKASLKESLRAEGNPPGLTLEDKRLSLTLHYRNSNWKERRFLAFVRKWVRSLPERDRPKLILGKKVANFLPAFGKDKGQAALACLKTLGKRGLVFIGDDVTDEAVFRLRRPDHFTIRIDHHAKSRARYSVRGIRGCEDLLRRLIDLA